MAFILTLFSKRFASQWWIVFLSTYFLTCAVGLCHSYRFAMASWLLNLVMICCQLHNFLSIFRLCNDVLDPQSSKSQFKTKSSSILFSCLLYSLVLIVLAFLQMFFNKPLRLLQLQHVYNTQVRCRGGFGPLYH